MNLIIIVIIYYCKYYTGSSTGYSLNSHTGISGSITNAVTGYSSTSYTGSSGPMINGYTGISGLATNTKTGYNSISYTGGSGSTTKELTDYSSTRYTDSSGSIVYTSTGYGVNNSTGFYTESSDDYMLLYIIVSACAITTLGSVSIILWSACREYNRVDRNALYRTNIHSKRIPSSDLVNYPGDLIKNKQWFV